MTGGALIQPLFARGRKKTIEDFIDTFLKFGAIPGSIFIYFLYFPYETYIDTIFILGLDFACWVSSWAGYTVNSCVWVNNSSCLAEGRVPGRNRPGAAVQQPIALATDLRCTILSYAAPYWVTLHPILSYAAPYWAKLHPTELSCTC